MTIRKSVTSRRTCKAQFAICTLTALLMVGCSSSDVNDHDQIVTPPEDPGEEPAPVQERIVLQGNDRNNIGSPLVSLNPQGPGGSPNQSLRSGDILEGGPEDNIIIGGLGVDVMIGGEGDDVIIGGTEDFNSNVDGDGNGSDNRDKAFGGRGSDLFIWTPGDGSDFYDGGAGVDVIAFGIVGEELDNDSSTTGAPFFNVSPPGTDGSQNFDGIFLDPITTLPTLSVSTSPGFCTVLSQSTNPTELTALALDNLVRFSIRGVANPFDAQTQNADDGLRVSLSLRNVEYVVCTKRDFIDGAGIENVEVLDISGDVPIAASIAALPEYIQRQIQ